MRITNSRLIILAVVAAGLFCWAVLQAHFAGPGELEQVEGYLLQGLGTENIGRVVISSGQDKVEIARADQESFVVASMDGYRAQRGEIRDMLVDLMLIKPGERVTDNPDNHAELGVTTETADAVVELFDIEDNRVAGMAITGGRGPDSPVYCRVLGQDVVYRLSRRPDIPTDVTAYVDTTLLEGVEADDVSRVEVVDGQDEFTLVRRQAEGEEAQWTLENLPEGKQVKQWEANSMVNRLDGLQFAEAMSTGSDQAANLSFDRKILYHLPDGLVYRMHVAKGQEGTYVRLEAGVVDVRTGDAEESDEEARAARMEAVQKAQQVNLRHDGWAYRLESWQASSFTKSRGDLLEDKPEPEEPAADADADEGAEAGADADAGADTGQDTAPAGEADASDASEAPDQRGDGGEAGSDQVAKPAADGDETPAGEAPAAEGDGDDSGAR
jgi:hypothetical protein